MVTVRRLGWTGRQMFMGTVAPVSPCPAMLWPPLHVRFLCGTPYSDKMGHCCITFYCLSVLRDCGRVGKRKRRGREVNVQRAMVWRNSSLQQGCKNRGYEETRRGR